MMASADYAGCAGSTEGVDMGRVVVGVDATPGSRAAVRWAIEYARERGHSLTFVHAYVIPAHPSPAGPVRTPEMQRDARERGRRQADRALSVAQAVPGLEADAVVAEGDAVELLVAQAADADLLVLGAHEAGGLLRLRRLGSVLSRCLHAAPCPVVVVPEREASP